MAKSKSSVQTCECPHCWEDMVFNGEQYDCNDCMATMHPLAIDNIHYFYWGRVDRVVDGKCRMVINI